MPGVQLGLCIPKLMLFAVVVFTIRPTGGADLDRSDVRAKGRCTKSVFVSHAFRTRTLRTATRNSPCLECV
jgi:hypothetical protein